MLFCDYLQFVAVRQKSYDMVLSLIMGGAFVEQVCLTKWTATHEAAKVSSAVLILANASVNPRTETFSHTCLPPYLLYQVGCPAIMMLLLRHGAKINSRNAHGVTPLGIAAEFGNTEVLEILINHGKMLNS